MNYKAVLDAIQNNWVLICALISASVNLAVGYGYLAKDHGDLWIVFLVSLGLVLFGVIQRSAAYGPKTVQKMRGGRR